MKYLLLFFLFINIYLPAQQDTIYSNLSFDEMVDSLLSELDLDSSIISFRVHSANVKDVKEANLNFIECPSPLILQPDIDNYFDPSELDLVLKHPQLDFTMQMNFLTGNDIRDNLFLLSIDADTNLVKMEQIGIDINVNYGEIITTGYYADNLLRYYHQIECKRIFGVTEHLFFFYEDNVLVKVKALVKKDSGIMYKEFFDNKLKAAAIISGQ